MKINNRHISRNIFFSISILVCLLISFFFTVVKTYADTLSLGVYPPLLKIRTSPSSHIQQRIIISNYGGNPTMVAISFKMFTSSDKKNGEIIFLPSTNKAKDFFSEYVKVLDGSIPVNQVLLAPQQHKSLTLDITVPKQEAQTDYYISILFISNTAEEIKSNASLLSEGIATNVLLSVYPQPEIDLGYIQQFTGPRLVDNPTTPFSIEAVNPGNHFLDTKGTITINNMLFGTKEIIQIQSTTLLGNSSRYMTDSVEKSLTHVLWKHGFLFGIYRADVALYFGNNQEAFHKVIYFYSYPIVGFAIALVIFIFIGIVAFRIWKKRI